ncbi:hypothetical protein LJC19_04615, partial [Oxalobacter sp. OttesenSCG-928-P03]|nr:hypothetical protein [Oxalobacter sp. OttesenSCG-928-P03]
NFATLASDTAGWNFTAFPALCCVSRCRKPSALHVTLKTGKLKHTGVKYLPQALYSSSFYFNMAAVSLSLNDDGC